MKTIQMKFRELCQRKPEYPLRWAMGIVVICMLWIFVTPVYSGDNDNYDMALIVNRMLTGEGQDVYISYLNPVLCVIFQIVLRLMPMADCFVLTAQGMLLYAVGVFAYVLALKTKNYFELFGYYSVFLAIVFLQNLFNYNFTCWSAFFAAVGMLVLLLLVHGKIEGKRWSVTSAVLLCLGVMWRYESALLFVPFIVLDLGVQFLWTVKTWEARKVFMRRNVKILAVPMFSLAVISLLHIGIFYTERYREAKEYDDARSTLLDYPLKAWEEIKDEIPEITENDYNMVSQWILMDVERIDTQFLTEMSESGRKDTETGMINLSYILNMQKRIFSVFMNTRTMQYLLGITGVVFVLFILSKQKWYYKIQAVCACLGTDVICMYFEHRGRALERVYLLALYALLMSLVVLLLSWKERRGSTYELRHLLMTAIGLFGIVYSVNHTVFAPKQSVFTTKNYDIETYSADYKAEELYIWSIKEYCKKPMQYFLGDGKLMSSDYLAHNIYAGAWSYGQVYFGQLLEKIGIENPMRELLENENAYYVAEDSQMVLTYLQEHFDENVTVEQVKEIDGIPVWRFYSNRNGSVLE